MAHHRIDPQADLATADQAELLAWMATQRSHLLAQLTGLDERILCEEPVMGGWTVKDMLAHVAHWDGFFARSVELALVGRAAEVALVSMDAVNAAVHAGRQAWSLAVVLDELGAARAAFLAAFSSAPTGALDIEWQFGWGCATLRRIAEWRGYHDSEHATQIEDWRASKGQNGTLWIPD
jgi:hypothetical protein